VPDALFDDPRMVELYDPLDPDRSDLDVYEALVGELGASSVLDIGCGTGTLACRLALAGRQVVGVDPSGASIQVARRKAGADRVRWVVGEVATVLPLQVDLATMTANVAQVFTTEEHWRATLRATREALRPGGRLVLETRDPRQRAWERWTRERTDHVTHVEGVGEVRDWDHVVEVRGSPDGLLVTFESMIVRPEGLELPSTSTLRFPTREQVETSLRATGLELDEVRDAPDRPGAELVFVARRPG
jgi:SAM-dependent methyltransferase